MTRVDPRYLNKFTLYRNTYNFTDKEVIFFVASLGLFFIYLLYSFFAFSILEVQGRMFFLFLFPVSLFILFDLKSKYINRKRRKVLLKRKLQKSKQLEKIFIFEEDDNNLMVSKFSPEVEIEIKERSFLDIKYELKTIALENNYDAIIGVKKENGIVKGFLAKKIKEEK